MASKKLCAADDCDVMFTPITPWNIYCCYRCADRMGSRNRWENEKKLRDSSIAQAKTHCPVNAFSIMRDVSCRKLMDACNGKREYILTDWDNLGGGDIKPLNIF